MRSWSRACGALGIATMALPGPLGLPINPVAVAALALWSYSRWTMIAHHTCHGGYNRAGDVGRFRSNVFALGSPGVESITARTRDWLDWMLPEAWNHEHNSLHHYRLGEDRDPDLVERNLDFVRRWRGPLALKYAFVGAMACVWKWAYYSPNTFKQLKLAEHRAATKAGKDVKPLPENFDPNEALTILGALFKPRARGGLFSPMEFVGRCVGPVVALRFLLLPAPLLLLGPQVPGFLGAASGLELFQRAVVTLVAADIVSNLHGFLTIVTNHAGKDLYRFSDPCPPGSPTFLMRQVVSSANYRTGGDLNDFMHGFLNYQVEHHAWPSLSMLSYQRAQPRLQEICERHGVPYVQESVFERLRKTLDIMVGRSSMRPFPREPVITSP